MEKFRISNDLSIFWSITNKDGSPYTLSDKTVRLFVTHPRGRVEVTQDITIQDNVICWLFRGSKQRYLGTYRITAEIQASPADRTIRKDIPEAFELVSSSQYEQTEIGKPDISEEGELTLATSLDIFQIKPIIPQVGPNRNWWVDGVDTGKSSVGLTAYEFAKEQGYEGTEEEYAAECLAVPVLNEESREATEAATKAAEAATIAAKSATDAAESANNASAEASTNASQAAVATASANEAAEKANEAAEKAEETIEAFGSVIANKADKIKFDGKYYVETDGISTDDFYYSMPDSADGTEDDIIATKSYLKKINGQDLYGKGNIVIEGKNYDNEIAELDATKLEGEKVGTTEPTEDFEISAEIEAKLAELSEANEVLKEAQQFTDVAIKDLQDMKIDRENDDYYPKMAVGLADNLAGVDVVDSEINFRRSGGGAISDGVARIETIKGNSVVWNEIFKAYPGSVGTKVINGVTYTLTAEGDLTAEGTAEGANAALVLSAMSLIGTHKYLILVPNMAVSSWGDVALYAAGYNTDANQSQPSNGWSIFKATNTAAVSLMLTVWAGKSISLNTRLSYYDLTQMFGSGNEPTTIEEFYQRIPMGVDLNAYNEGEVIHMNVQSIESQGVNAWDEEWENIYINSSGEVIKDTARIGSKNYIPIIPHSKYYVAGGRISFAEYDADKNFIAMGDNGSFSGPNASLPISQNARYIRFFTATSYGTTYKGDICINLSDTAINGKYYPYIKRVEDLSIIRKYFPQGMKSAPTAHDEIRYNKASGKWEKVEATGIRAYQEGDADNASYLTDGKVTCYPLAEPIVTELDEADQFKDLDYQVWNAGTEKAIAEGKSAPLAADITYGFNAIGKIKELESLVAALRAKVGI